MCLGIFLWFVYLFFFLSITFFLIGFFSYLSTETATKLSMDDIPLSNSTNELSLHICPSWSHVTTKYSNISNGINMSKSSRSAHANEMRNVAVGERNLPRLAQVTITTEFPITPIMNVIAWVRTMVINFWLNWNGSIISSGLSI